ncbi:MAG TPA: helix-turn-helix domain-containing protein [Hyphomicrobium sp.]|jgi:hypothetical protein|nr:helix-turn-helix domain-containing protein [Hyphomicrobium sp.]
MSDVVDKWGDAVAGRGFAQVPNYLLLANHFLDPALSPVELLVLIQLTAAWWRKGELPFPSVSTLSKRCGVSSRQIQRTIGQLEKHKLVKRVARRSGGFIASNAYDLAPLVEFLNRVAKAFPNAFPRQVTARATPVKVSEKGAVPKQLLSEGKVPVAKKLIADARITRASVAKAPIIKASRAVDIGRIESVGDKLKK